MKWPLLRSLDDIVVTSEPTDEYLTGRKIVMNIGGESLDITTMDEQWNRNLVEHLYRNKLLEQVELFRSIHTDFGIHPDYVIIAPPFGEDQMLYAVTPFIIRLGNNCVFILKSSRGAGYHTIMVNALYHNPELAIRAACRFFTEIFPDCSEPQTTVKEFENEK